MGEVSHFGLTRPAGTRQKEHTNCSNQNIQRPCELHACDSPSWPKWLNGPISNPGTMGVERLRQRPSISEWSKAVEVAIPPELKVHVGLTREFQHNVTKT